MPRISTPVVRAVAIGLAAVVFVVLLMVSTGGQLDVVHAPAHTTAAAAHADVSGPPIGSSQPKTSDLGVTGFLIGLILLGGFIIVGIAALLLSLRKILGGRRHIARVRVTDDDRLLDAVAEDAHEHLAALRQGEPRDAIIACWMSLESTMRRIGLEPDEAETPTELVQRVLSAYPVERAPIERLAALYREARFSTHEIPETSRSLAVGAIERLHTELSGVRRGQTRSSVDGRGR